MISKIYCKEQYSQRWKVPVTELSRLFCILFDFNKFHKIWMKAAFVSLSGQKESPFPEPWP